MAWYFGTYRCGHEGRVELYGKSDDRERRKNNIFGGLCPECTTEFWASENIRLSEEEGCARLRGSKKQIAWAVQIRQSAMQYASVLLRENPENAEHEIRKAIYERYLDYLRYRQMEAKWFIDSRYRLSDRLFIAETLQKMDEQEEARNRLKEVAAKSAPESPAESRPTTETTEMMIKPVEIKHTGEVRLTIERKKIVATYPKDDDFIKLMRDNKLHWDSEVYAWVWDIDITMGDPKDRVADLANVLLAAGFIVLIPDQEARKRAISGNYQPRHSRWVSACGDDKFGLHFEREDDDAYKAVKKLTRWQKWNQAAHCYDVPGSQFEGVQELCNIYDFWPTKKAKERLAEQRAKLDAVIAVQPQVKVEALPEDGLKAILESSREVLPDLRDDL